MRREKHAHVLDELAIPRHLKQHPVYRTPGLSFQPLPIARAALPQRRLPEPGELHLWRFRAQRHAGLPEDSPPIVSRVEQHRARRGPSSALNRRYLTGRASLRAILSRMLACPPEHLQFTDRPDGQPELLHPLPPRQLSIRIAYAGIWILIGMGASEFGISAATPSGHDPTRGQQAWPPADAADANDASESAPADPAEAQDFVRRSSAAALCKRPSADWLPRLVAQNGAALIAEESSGNYLHVIDLPMPGRLNAAVAMREPVSVIRAYGWCRN
ncbi:4'-phosphopantetheinyl transferase family protein [Paraburkholderia caballeronis]|uniref:4'-phosphopantetheinyl transferase n=1 Tax=Paraburkholderia caballeronis TaxID=416943 RepID=A0A1H7FEH9_9BURK|nr:hypothetical protein [Paraburkholderia caballeronis]PXW25037.1 hypothetical protein C7403_106358 [Paraburkholderia caballeronis]PXW93221.1 hypothetical protein C7407_12912 [Paraburkholderia caballeronis]RAJ86672.1 hypothetical protein C7409_12912 [Paraburkholderia caballeronis]SEE73706.1 hypothetical protein SAMN05445871_5967 [Paraburkholderia caballeronis]SEK24379.1 hypothetical protein SAMN05192542_101296 [Paraburkholderia caballeronis]